MIKINLLPYKAAQKREQMIIHSVALGVVIAVVFVACIGIHLVVSSKISAIEVKTFETNSEISALKKVLKEIENFRKLQDELKEKIDVLDQLKKAKSGPVYLLDGLNRLLPDKMWLTDFNEKGGKIVIKGIGLNEETVAVFLRDLEKSDYYMNVVLIEISQTTKVNNSVQSFTLECQRQQQSVGSANKAKGQK